MNKIIQVTRTQDEKTIYINIDHIISFELEESSGGSKITFSQQTEATNQFLWINENPSSLKNRINSATK